MVFLSMFSLFYCGGHVVALVYPKPRVHARSRWLAYTLSLSLFLLCDARLRVSGGT